MPGVPESVILELEIVIKKANTMIHYYITRLNNRPL